MTAVRTSARRRAPVGALAATLFTLSVGGARAEAQAPIPPASGASESPDGGEAGEGFAQQAAVLPDGSRRAAGRVIRPERGRDRPAPVGGVFVTLHRVGRDSAGPIDSVRTGADGAYAFRYRPSGAGDALYFASTSYGGIAYFSTPFRDAVVTGDPAEILVFDTTSANVALATRGRHVVVSAPDAEGTRSVVEVWELSNDTTLTIVPGPRPGGVWSAPLPRGATGLALRPNSDLPADALRAVGGRATLLAPFAPGVRQVAYAYRLPDDAFPVRIPGERAMGVLEVLVEEPQGTATGAGLALQDAAAVEGRTFRRWLAQEVPAGTPVTIDIPAPPSAAGRWILPAALVATAAGLLVVWAGASRRRRPAGAAPAVGATPDGAVRPPAASGAAREPAPDTRERLLAALAALDDAWARRTAGGMPSEAEADAHAREREALKRRLAGLLADAPAAR